MHLLKNLLPVVGITHQTEELTLINVHVLQDDSSQHFTLVEVFTILPLRGQLDVWANELVARGHEPTAAFEAPVADEGRTDYLVDGNHASAKLFNDAILNNWDRFVLLAHIAIHSWRSHRKLLEEVQNVLYFVHRQISTPVDQQCGQDKIPILVKGSAFVHVREILLTRRFTLLLIVEDWITIAKDFVTVVENLCDHVTRHCHIAKGASVHFDAAYEIFHLADLLSNAVVERKHVEAGDNDQLKLCHQEARCIRMVLLPVHEADILPARNRCL